MDFDKLLQDVMENPELLLNPDLVSNEQLQELQKKINPYINLSEMPCGPDEKYVAACSYTNLREDYIRRFTMTSLVTFMFQVLHEHEVPKDLLICRIENENETEPFNIKLLKERIDTLSMVVNELEETNNTEQKLNRRLTMQELLDESSDNLIQQVAILNEKKTGLLYTITQMIKEFGISADNRLKSTTILANKYPSIKEIIKSKYPSNKEFSQNVLSEQHIKTIIKDFLLQWLSFDASIHIREGHECSKIKTELVNTINGQQFALDPDDPGHLTLESIRAKIEPTQEDRNNLEIFFRNKRACNAAIHIIRDENLHDPIKYMLQSEEHIERFKQYLLPLQKLKLEEVPSQDTFHRWNYFTEVNYEELRTITECLYPERPDLDWAVAIWNIFKGTETEVTQQFTEFCQKHHDELPSSIRSIEIGKWTLLGDFKENRKNLQFYNKNTEVLKRIIDRHTEDKKIGTELMRNRVRQAKAKNIAEEGPDAPGLKSYKATISTDGKDLVSKGVEKVISPEEMKRLEKARGNLKAAKELEVLEEYEKVINGFNEIKKYRDLTVEENDKYTVAEKYISQAKEMLNVPDNAIQVDVFTTDTKTGTFNKSKFYTKSDEAIEKGNIT